MTSFVEYRGADSVYTLGRTWRPGDRVSVQSLCKDFGERAGDTESGSVFINWLSSMLDNKPTFSLHIDSNDLKDLAAAGSQGGKETVESGPISVAGNAKAAASKLTEDRPHGQQVSEQPLEQRGSIEESEEPQARTKRSTRRVSSVKAVKEALSQESEPITGESLEVQKVKDSAGSSDAFIAQPTNSEIPPKKRSESQPVLMANPSPSLSPSSKVSTGRDGIITNLPEVNLDNQMANIVPQDRRSADSPPVGVEDLQPITGEDLAAASDPEMPNAVVNTAPSAEASAIGGKTRPAFQGSTGAREVTLDHIVRAENAHKAIDAVNECRDRSILSVAKMQLSNSGGAQRVIDKIDSRMKFLKSRGL